MKNALLFRGGEMDIENIGLFTFNINLHYAEKKKKPHCATEFNSGILKR